MAGASGFRGFGPEVSRLGGFEMFRGPEFEVRAVWRFHARLRGFEAEVLRFGFKALRF